MRRFKARLYVVKGVYLMFNDRTLIASQSSPDIQTIDRDLFAATLDVIQNFMRTSFPILSGRSLRTIEHGELRIIIERGRFCYLACVVSGQESDLLRRQLRDELLAFEDANSRVLGRWRGLAEEALGADEALLRILAGSPQFLPTGQG